MGIWDTLTGKDAAEASRRAAADTFSKQQAAAEASRAAGNAYQLNLANLSQAYNPYVQGGQRAQTAVYDLYGLNGLDAQNTAFGNFRADPGYGYQVQQGLKAVDNSAAARGTLNSGATLKALQDRGNNLADQSFGAYRAGLAALGQQGLGATQAQTGLQAQGYQGQLQGNLAASGQQFGSANTIGLGDVAAANAESQGMGNMVKLGMQGVGMLMGMPGGVPGLGSIGSSFGSAGPSVFMGAPGSNPWMKNASWGSV